MQIIDIHTHAISPDTTRFPLAPLGGKQSDWSRTRPVSAEELLAAMDEAGIAKVALVHASTAYGHDASYVVDCVRRYPDRFAGVFSLDMLADDETAQFDRWRSAGLSGLRLFTTGSTSPGQAGCRARSRGTLFRHRATALSQARGGPGELKRCVCVT